MEFTAEVEPKFPLEFQPKQPKKRAGAGRISLSCVVRSAVLTAQLAPDHFCTRQLLYLGPICDPSRHDCTFVVGHLRDVSKRHDAGNHHLLVNPLSAGRDGLRRERLDPLFWKLDDDSFCWRSLGDGDRAFEAERGSRAR